MKLNLTTLLLLLLLNAYGQGNRIGQEIQSFETNGIVFQHISVFTLTNSEIIPESVVSNAGILEFNQEKVKGFLSNPSVYILVSIPMSVTKTIELKLYRVNFFADGYKLSRSSTDNPESMPSAGLHFRGIVDNDYNSVASISFYENEIMGLISTPAEGNVVVGKISEDFLSRHIIYNDKDLHWESNQTCMTNEIGGTPPKPIPGNSIATANCVRMYWEINYDLFISKGDINTVTNYVTGLFNQSATLFYNDGLSVILSEIFVWDTPSPYDATTIMGLIYQYHQFREPFNGDIAHLISVDYGGGLASNTGTLCDANLNNMKCYSGVASTYANVPLYSSAVQIVTHEQGHIMGSRHTHACVWNGNNTAIDACGPTKGYSYEGSCNGASIPTNGGTIMSFCHLLNSVGINFSNGFGTQPRNAITNVINAAPCLSACATSSCDMTTGLVTTSITNTSAMLSWTESSFATSYNVRYKRTNTSAWTTSNTTDSKLQLSGLTASSLYEWQVQKVCPFGTTNWTESVLFTTAANPACTTPGSLTASQVISSTVNLTWSKPSAATGYKLQWRRASSSSWNTVSNISENFYNLSGLNSCTAYQFRVQSVCSGSNSSYSSYITYNTIGCTYCSSKASSSGNHYINRVVLGTIDNTSGNNSGYRDYTSLNTTLTKGTPYTISLTPRSGNSDRKYWSVYIDYNRNGVFSESSERVATGSGTGSVSLNFTVPFTAQSGATRMRIIAKTSSYASSSCSNYSYGETEDYTVNLTNGTQFNSGGETLFASTQEELFDVYPNPATDRLIMNFKNPGNYHINVINISGQKVHTDKIYVAAPGEVELNTSGFAEGVYFIVIDGSSFWRKRFLIVR